MQTIKFCPQCSKSAPSGKHTFCPYDGTPLVEMQAASTPPAPPVAAKNALPTETPQSQTVPPQQSNYQENPEMKTQEMTYCSKCGQQLQAGANFCSRCAAPISQQSNQLTPLHFSGDTKTPEEKKFPSLWTYLLGGGIFLMPYIFAWFTLRKGYSNHFRVAAFGWLAIFIMYNVVIRLPRSESNSAYSVNSTATSANSASFISSNNMVSTTSISPSSLSSSENLTLGKKALSDGDLSEARSHLSAIPKDSKEFASAKQYLATLEKRERRKSIEDELHSVEHDQAGNERALDLYENMEGSIGRGSYLNALKEKGRLQLLHIQLERKLKSMP